MTFRLAASLVFATAVVALAPSMASAATYTVTTTGDPVPAGGACVGGASCSVREAVAAATTAGDRVQIPAGRYVTSRGPITANAPIVIDGAGAGATTIDAQGTSRVLGVTLGSSGDATISDMTITGGASKLTDPATSPGDGGGVLFGTQGVGATLTLDGVRLTANAAEMQGGGLAAPPENPGVNSGTVVVRNSTIDNNTVSSTTNGQGGGLAVFGTLDLTNSTVTANSATGGVTSQGGGVLAGAVVPGVAATTLTNATIVANKATGPASAGTGAGGISGAGLPLNAKNSIVAGNTLNGAASDCAALLPGTLANDISSDTSCGFSAANGSKTNINAQVGTLADHGGPTPTLALAQTSPAVDAGTNSGCPATDQRGVARPQGSACDIGAVESAVPAVDAAVPTAIGTNEAVLRATVRNPLVGAGFVAFQYGRTTGYGATSAGTNLAAQTGATPIATKVTGLTSGAVWHYRAIAFNGDGLTTGPDRGFNTLAAGKKPFLKVSGLPKVCRKTTFEMRFRTRVTGQGVSFDGARVTRDGRSLKLAKKVGRFRLKVNPARLKAGRHVIGVRVRDSKNRLTTYRKAFRRCAPVVKAKRG